MEAEAREAKRGLWAEPDPIPPWVYRHPEQAKEEGFSASNAKGLLTLPQPRPQAGGLIIGNKRSQVYHRPDCPSYTATSPKNRELFESEEAAEKAGYHLAGNCP